MRTLSVIFIVLFTLLSTVSSEAQDIFCNRKLADEYLQSKGEVYFSFTVFDKASINSISKIISIDNVKDFEVFAYANRNEFDEFLRLNIPYYVLPHPGDVKYDLNMKSNIDNIEAWDYYPTYDAYVAMMNQFAATYPNMCQIVNIGSTVSGRQLLIAKIKNNINTNDGRPKFMYTSSMHGDETTGYVLMLRLIDYLLTNYGTNTRVTNLMNNVEIYINPLANPDGTYRGGNGTVNGAVRYNTNNYDLNRNYPGVDGPNSATIQLETQNFMNFATSNNLSLSCNFHGGVEVVNYPWDSWSRLCTDDAWWIRASRQYADTVHSYAASGYMTYLMNGITNGYAWYYVHGSRQDYQCYYRHSREVTIELSNVKLLAPVNLPAHWDYNYRSFLGLMEKLYYGIRGTVTDSLTGNPLSAKVYITGFDADSSEIYSDSQFGKYYRLITAGNYNITFSAPDYYSKTINNVHAANDSATNLNVQLRPIVTASENSGTVVRDFALQQNYPNPFNPSTVISFQLPVNGFVSLNIYDITGRLITSLVNKAQTAGSYNLTFDGSNLTSGIYFYKIAAGSFSDTKKMVLIK